MSGAGRWRRSALALAAAGLSAAAGAQEAGVLSLRGVNLAGATWFAAADLAPDADADLIVDRAVPTSPTAALRTDVAGGAGTLFTFLDLESAPPPGLGALVTIGDADGDDETFFNGEKIGGTRGWGVTDNGQPRAYHVPHRLLKAGRNVLAVRLTGFSGRTSFRISREPLTFAFVPATPEPASGAPAAPGLGVTALPEDEARAAIAAADATTSGAAEPLLRKRASFGRFGHFLQDGLPAVSEVSPTRVETRGGPAFEVALDSVAKAEVATGKGEPGIDGWHKLTRVTGAISGKPVRYTALQHVMYPGAVFTLEEGAVLRLNVRFPGRNGAIHPLSREEARDVFGGGDGTKGTTLQAFAVYEPEKESAPAVLAVEGAAANVAQTDDGRIDVTFARSGNGKGPSPRVFVFYPGGLRRFNLSGRPATFAALATATDPDTPSTTTLRRWMRAGLHAPAATDEYFRARPAAGLVRIYQTTRFDPLPDGTEAVGDPLLVLPPQIEFARRSLNYPVGGLAVVDTGILAFSGPVYAARTPEETTATAAAAKSRKPTAKDRAQKIHVAWYDLPIPPVEERGLIAVPNENDLKEMLNAHLTDLGTSVSLTAVDSLYKSRAQGFQAYSYLTPENRVRLLENAAELTAAALRGDNFHETTEPLSGIPFWWTYFIEGPHFDRFDQDWGNGLALAGLHYIVKYTGDWEPTRRDWKGVERMFSWFAATDDWEWMRASNSVHGHGTGAGDCMNAAYAGALAYAKLARGCGLDDEFHYGLYTAARAALPAVNRFAYDGFADKHDFKPPSSLVLGFHEGRGFLVGELDGYAWNATSMISGNGVQPENFDLYAARAPEALREYEKTFEKFFPHWADGAHRYPRPTLYHNNSGYITLPHIYLRTRFRTDGFEKLTELLRSARANKRLWWLAPPVIAEAMNMKTEGAHVADWGRCSFLGSALHYMEKKKKRLELHFDTRSAAAANAPAPPPETVIVALPRAPDRITINDGPVPLTDSAFADGRLTVKLRRPGVNKIEIIY